MLNLEGGVDCCLIPLSVDLKSRDVRVQGEEGKGQKREKKETERTWTRMRGNELI